MPRWTPMSIVGGAYSDDTKPWSTQDTVNYIPVKIERPGGRSNELLRSAPGLKPYVDIGNGPIRGLHDVEGMLLAVSGNRLYKISTSRVAIPVGTIPGVSRVSMAHNQITGGSEVMIATGSAGYVYNTVADTLEKVTDDGFPGFKICDFVDGYIAGIEPGGRFWLHSELADAKSYNTLDRSDSEAQPDKLVSLIVDHREVWVLNERTIEPFENTGAVTGTFKRVGGTVIEAGCDATFATAKLDNSVFWLGGGSIFRANGYTPQRISTHAIEQALARCNLSRAFMFTYEDRGHKIVYLTCPDGHTWGYDAATGEWHRRQSYGLDRWRLNALVKSRNLWIGGDYASGKLYTVDWDYMLEDQAPLVSERIAGVLHDNQNRVTVNAVEVVMDTGGVETIAADFPEQPPSPTISGAAPDGTAGVAYAGYTYSITGGTGPYVVTLRSGTLPPGLALSSAGVLDDGPGTSIGDFTFTFRATDANGMWDEHTDTISMAPLMFATLVAGPSSDLQVTSAPYDWSGNTVSTGLDTIGGFVESRAGAVHAFGPIAGNNTGAVSFNAGATFNLCTGLPTSLDIVSLVYADSTWIAVPESGTDLYVSTDGIAFTARSYAAGSQVTTSAIAIDNLVIVARSNSSQSRMSEDGGHVWADCPLVSPVQTWSLATSGASIIACTNSDLKRSVNEGVSWSAITNPLPSGNIHGIAYGNGIYLIVNAAGDCATSANDGVTWDAATATYSLGGSGVSNKLIFDGERFVLATNAKIVSTADGLTWVDHNTLGVRSLAVFKEGQ